MSFHNDVGSGSRFVAQFLTFTMSSGRCYCDGSPFLKGVFTPLEKNPGKAAQLTPVVGRFLVQNNVNPGLINP